MVVTRSLALCVLLASSAIQNGTAFQAPALLSRTRSTSSLGVSEKLRPEEVVAEVADDVNAHAVEDPVFALLGQHTPPPFKKVMAANRAEIAIRIMRASTELNMETVGIFGYEDRYSQHNWGADYSFMLEKKTKDSSPVSAYLDIDQIIKIAKDNDVEAIHPGYGFLSESPEFAVACEKAGITFVGPTVENLLTFSDKTSAREAAIAAGVPVIPGSPSLTSTDEVEKYVADIGLPVILKAAMGGGGKGMRVVRNQEDLLPFFESASSEALAAFGDGAVFVERYVEDPRHIEIQIVGDGTGNVVHLWERDCSIQRRHQKVVEMAPAFTLSDDLRAQLHKYATELTSKANYRNAGTVEFLIDSQNRPYFIEVNPRIQVEHTVTEEVTGIDLVKAQLKIAAGGTLEEVGLIQENIFPRGVAIQCRVTTENPEKDFLPDTGKLTVYRHSAGGGIRMDGVGYAGYTVTPYYDSLLCKYTARGATFEETVSRMKRALQEIRIRGVQTNVSFLLNVLCHPEFEKGIVTTSFIDQHPELKTVTNAAWNFASPDQKTTASTYNTEKLLRYLADLAVNGHVPELGASADVLRAYKESGKTVFVPPRLVAPAPSGTETRSHRDILLQDGPDAYAKHIRSQKQLFVMDTTWRDAHQSLLATRMRTRELVKSAEYTNAALRQAFSLEMWGGATFDVSMRFLKECPWERLEKLRAEVPDVPFQMLLRGANAVGYKNYPDNVVYAFCKQAKESGIDIFRVFDSLNYLPNLQLGVDAAKAAGAFVEGTISYTGDVSDPNKTKYDLDYYLQLAKDLNDMGVHSLCIKDMAGLLTPQASTMLISAIRAELPDIPIHVHTHDTAGNGVASMLAAANAGADIVDAAMDSFSGMTSQPSLGALVAAVRGTDLDTKLDMSQISELNTYWENVRTLYAPFESGQLSGSSDVYVHEIPGGQYTNLLFQSKQLGLTEKWPQIKHMYAEANKVLGDIPKVTPSSKVVGDLAQFMVSQNLDAVAVVERADKLAFPESTVGYLRGEIGIPPGGFTEPLRSKVLESHGLTAVLGRPGAELEDYDFEKAEVQLHKNMLALHINMCAVVPFIPRYLKVGTNIKLFMGLCQIWTRICSCIHSRREKKRSWKLVPAKRLSLNSCPKKRPTRRDHAQ
jgi:pyruvate carboxylase